MDWGRVKVQGYREQERKERWGVVRFFAPVGRSGFFMLSSRLEQLIKGIVDVNGQW